jgi:hypothetical protein
VIAVKRGTILATILAIPGLISAAFPVSQGFIENRGQMDEGVLYYAKGPQASVYFTRDAVVLDLHGESESRNGIHQRDVTFPGPATRGEEREPPSRRGCVIRIGFEGANPIPSVEGGRPLTTRYNYFLGEDPMRWRRGVQAFEEVRYRGLWLDVNLVFSVEGGRIVYDVVGARERMRFRYEGADDVKIMDDGSLHIETPVGTVVNRSPNGSGRGAFLFEQRSAQCPGGDTGQRDDPEALLWSTFLGFGLADYGTAIVLDSSGHFVITGSTESPSFPTTSGAYDRTYNGMRDVFVSKLSPSGDDLVWSTFIGGDDWDDAWALDLDAEGDAVVTGSTWSWDFPTTEFAFDQSHSQRFDDVFVAKLSLSGNELLWSTFLGGDWDEYGRAVDIDGEGNPVVTGNVRSPDFPTTPGAYDDSQNGSWDVFACKLSSTGSDLLLSTRH